MRFSESIRKVARRLADGHAEQVGDPSGWMPVNRAVLRSIAAILVGWLVALGGYIVTIVVIALFNPEVFKPAEHYSIGYWLISLFVDLIYSVVGGFVTGVIARRREVAHAIGLVIFGLLVSKCWPSSQTNTISVPNWYWIAGYVLTPLFTVLGGWLRMRQAVLLAKIPQSVTRTMDEARLSIAITVDHSRPLIAILAAFATFVAVFSGGVLLGALGVITVLDRLFGKDCQPHVMLPVLVASLILASILSRRVFRRIGPRDTSLITNRRQE